MEGKEKVIRIMFVCHGNICRSTMAEFLMKDLVREKGLEERFVIKSSGVSSEEHGNPVHRGTRAVLEKRGISCAGKYAETLKSSDYENYDYFIGMDAYNLSGMRRILGGDPDGKISLLLDYTDCPRDVADPYWTGDFSETESDIECGVNAFFAFLIAKKII